MVPSEDLALLEQVDAVASSFERSWQQGRCPSIATFLSVQPESVQRRLLPELVMLDLSYRCKSGQPRRLEEYAREFPQLLQADGSLPSELVLQAREIGERHIRAATTDQATTPSPRGQTVRCPDCGERAGALGAGKEVHCGQCGRRFTTEPAAGVPFAAADLPRTLGKFQLQELLGQGSFGAVYRARDEELGRTVAIKVPRLGAVAGEAEQARFVREARTAAKLTHRAIVQVHEIGRDAELIYIVSDYIEGRTLAQSLALRRPGFRETAELCAAIADGLTFAHEHGVVHRDINARNILIDKDGKPHIADFGLARGEESSVLVSVDGQILGTPAYMSPEQAEGRLSQVGPASDIYSLGVVLYELLTGATPFRGTVTVLLRQVSHEDPPPPRRFNHSVPRYLETICLKCLRKEPNKRYATAAELAVDLRCFLNGEPPLHARPMSVAERARKWCRRHPVRATSIAGLILVLVAAAVLLYLERRREQAARAASLVQSLKTADTAHVDQIIRDLDAYRPWADPLLRTMLEEAAPDSKEQLHASLALLGADRSQLDFLRRRLLRSSPEELVVIRQALLPFDRELAEFYWTVAEDAAGERGVRLRAASALAAFDPDSPRWPGIAADVVAALLTQDSLAVGSWSQLLRPVRLPLLEPLRTVFAGQGKPVERTLATSILADYAADRPEMLAELLMDADQDQFLVVFPRFQEQAQQALSRLTGEIDSKLPANPTDQDRERLARRQANAAVALLKLNRLERVWPLLKHSEDPRARSYLIHWLGPLGADFGDIVRRLDDEADVSIRRALILSMGAAGDNQIAPDERRRLIAKLKEMYRKESDPGLHAAAEWLLRTWKHDDWLREINQAWAHGQEQRDRFSAIEQSLKMEKEQAACQWYVNSQGQTMVVFPGPVTFVMGSPPAEAGRYDDEMQHRRKIGRSFAIAARPVTVEELRRFDKAYKFNNRYAPEDECPVVGATWYEAAAYCNWLSDQEHLDKCYEQDERGNVISLKKNCLSLTGYRLPREAELEYACRARALTSRYYGESAELLGQYAWFKQNSAERSWSVGTKKPNDFGLFDMHGNIWNWCQEKRSDYPQGEPQRVFDDVEEDQAIDPQDPRVLRGASFDDPAANTRSADRYGGAPSTRNSFVGFRVARTLVP